MDNREAALRNVGDALNGWAEHLHGLKYRRNLVLSALHKLREHSGLSLRQAAKRARISPASLSLAERGELELSWDAAARVYNAYRRAAASSPVAHTTNEEEGAQ